jgi:hypothetical protein
MYIVYINNKEVKRVKTVSEVWDTIGGYPFSYLYFIDHEDKDVNVSEFIPF